MLSKKILQLKKKIKNFEQRYLDEIFERKLFFLNEKIVNQHKTICSLQEEISNLKANIEKKSLEDKSKIEALFDVASSLENYKDACSQDVTTLASAITEVYGILNHMLGGVLFKKKEDIVCEEVFYDDDLDFDEYIDIDGKKKKKKVYH